MPRNQAGFTLVELMVAMTILAVVAALLSTTLATALHTTDAVRDEAELTRRAETALRRLADDLANICAEPALPFQASAGAAQGLDEGADTLFFAARHLPLSPGDSYRGPALIGYRLERENGKPGFRLQRVDMPLLLGLAGDDAAVEAGYLLLADGVRSLTFEPLGQNGEAWHGGQRAGAGETGETAGIPLPAALRIRLELWQSGATASRVYRATTIIPAGRWQAVQARRRVPGGQ